MATSLRGRDSELADLTRWLRESSSGPGCVVLVGGEAGIGKSALVSALTDVAAAAGIRVLVGRTTEDDGAPPYWPWLQILDPLGARHLIEAPSGTDPESERFTRQGAVHAALTSQSSLVVLEDAHRADPASLQLLTHVADQLATAPVMLVATFRPDPLDQVPGFTRAAQQLGRAPRAQRLDLTGLGVAAVAELLGDLATPNTVDTVTATSNGNPLLVRELARHLASGGSLASVPRSVRDSVTTRMGARSDQCVDAVALAAVSGRTFSAGVVAAAAGRPALEILAGLDEAVAAGLVEPATAPGSFRFVHALVRDALVESLSVSERALRHRAIAEAILVHDGSGDAQVSDLARHWDAAAVLGERATAATWCERAAAVADRRLAWDEAARLYDRAMELAGESGDPVAEYRRAIGSARARLHCDDLQSAIDGSVRAARAAGRAGRPDLMAEAVLVPEGRSMGGTELFELALDALAALPAEDHTMRARLHGLLVNFGFYVDQRSMAQHTSAAETQASQAADPLADLAAIRARHMISSLPEHAQLRLDLAERLGSVARAVRRPSLALWEPLWRIDALVELGRLPEAVATLPDLRRAVEAAATPIAGWHLLRTEAALAQAAGRLADALAHAEQARTAFATLESALAAESLYLGFRSAVDLHAGTSREIADRWQALDLSHAPPFLGELPDLGRIESIIGVGDIERARVAYRRISPAAGWSPPHSLWLHMHAMRVRVAGALGVLSDLPPLLDELARYRGMHVGTGAGLVNYFGAVELWLGVGHAALGRWDEADRDLTTAADRDRRAGAVCFVVQAEVERAEVLLARSGPGDRPLARSLLTGARTQAARLGMTVFRGRIDRALAVLDGPGDTGPLSQRELEIAALVAQGLTNREIARSLVISDRTAQNHVQHILTKLGCNSRVQIATWYREERP